MIEEKDASEDQVYDLMYSMARFGNMIYRLSSLKKEGKLSGMVYLPGPFGAEGPRGRSSCSKDCRPVQSQIPLKDYISILETFAGIRAAFDKRFPMSISDEAPEGAPGPLGRLGLSCAGQSPNMYKALRSILDDINTAWIELRDALLPDTPVLFCGMQGPPGPPGPRGAMCLKVLSETPLPLPSASE